LSKSIQISDIRRELRKLRRAKRSNPQIGWWIRGFYRALQLTGVLLPEIQGFFDEELKQMNKV